MSQYKKVRKELSERMGEQDHARDDLGRRLYCSANGCPMKASVFMEGSNELCSWHAAAPFVRWPVVTQELNECIASGGNPVRPEIRPAPWVLEARKRVKAVGTAMPQSVVSTKEQA